MRAGGLQNIGRRAVAALAACALAACATGSSYMGIPLDSTVAPDSDAAVRNLAARAQAGDKHAQLELGIAFEEGRGVPRDLDKAEKLYRLAAADSGGTRQVYVPPAGQVRGSILTVKDGAPSPGLPEARDRLSALSSVRRSARELPSGKPEETDQ
jgi:TPR repeat protein